MNGHNNTAERTTTPSFSTPSSSVNITVDNFLTNHVESTAANHEEIQAR